jgi:hypothetical protein
VYGHQRQAGIGEIGQQIVHRVHGWDVYVGLIAAVVFDGLGVGDAGEWRGYLVAGHAADLLHHGLDHGQDLGLPQVAHLYPSDQPAVGLTDTLLT